MTFVKNLLLVAILAVAGIAPVAARQVHTPQPGTAERTQILDAIRQSAGTNVRFIVHALRVAQGRNAQYAYAQVEPSKQEYDGGEFLLKYQGKWSVIWSVNGGGTDDCNTAAIYYRSALRTLEADGIDPGQLSPQLLDEYQRLAASAREDPDCTAIGDLGPELPPVATIPPKAPAS